MLIFYIIAYSSIILGGLLSAFCSRKASRLAMWLVAYLVLVAGIAQLVIIHCWEQLGLPSSTMVIMSLVLFNLGNLSTMLGCAYKTKYRSAKYGIYAGGLAIVISFAIILVNALSAPHSWYLLAFVIVGLIIIFSAPIGIILSIRRNP